MENVTFLDVLDENIDGKLIKQLRILMTRALETIWDLFFSHLDHFLITSHEDYRIGREQCIVRAFMNTCSRSLFTIPVQI